MIDKNITIIGSGNMGGAIAKGLLKAGAIDVNHLTITRTQPETPPELKALGLSVSCDNEAAIAHADIVILAIKPWAVSELVRKLAKLFKANTTLISVAAGVSVADLRTDLGRTKNIHLVRAMPNTAVGLCAGVTALVGETDEALPLAIEVFSKIGLVVSVPEEKFSAITALSGCGIGHALRFLRAGMSAGVEMGITPALAGEIFAQVMKGASELVLHSGNHPEVEVDRVCTPGGLTIHGLNEMENRGFSAAVIQGLLASLPRK